ncbi:MAG: L-rhamnose isomerase [Candidatus Margulisiibacteriota bacterium]
MANAAFRMAQGARLVQPAHLTDQIRARRYGEARQIIGNYGTNSASAMRTVLRTRLSLHCWQGDDVTGFEKRGSSAGSGGIQATGNYPGKARTPKELRDDIGFAASLVPGETNVNVHAIYLEAGKRIPRDRILPKHFKGYVKWAKDHHFGLDFNPTFFGDDPNFVDGRTLSHPDKRIRDYWVRHDIACRVIAASFAEELGIDSACNHWAPDGFKDNTTATRKAVELMKSSLDKALKKEFKGVRDYLESKLFGIGSESFVVGSHEFYLAYVIANSRQGLGLTYDYGHFHPTEEISKKLDATFAFISLILLHASRGVRWDSDHVLTINDFAQSVDDAIVAGGYLKRAAFALDYFDASINRISAYVSGARAKQRMLLNSLCTPFHLMKKVEATGDGATRLILGSNIRASLPTSDVWNKLCSQAGVPMDDELPAVIADYEKSVLSKRN